MVRHVTVNDVVSDINGNPYALTGLRPRRQQGGQAAISASSSN